MPYIHLQITKGATREQKRKLVEEFTASLVAHLGKRPEHTHIVIDEVEEENWGFAGMLTDEYRGNPTESGAPFADLPSNPKALVLHRSGNGVRERFPVLTPRDPPGILPHAPPSPHRV